MREPKGSVFILVLAVFAVIDSAPVAQEKLPHSQEYYDGYVKALVDHFDDLFRNVRDVSVDNIEEKSGDAIQNAAKKDDVQNGVVKANVDDNGDSRMSQQPNDQSETIQDRPYTNPEETGKPPITDTEKEEQPTPDAHLKNESDQGSPSTEGDKEIKQNMFKAEEASKLPETMQDIRFYTGKSKDFEDMKKRSTDSEASTNDNSVTAKTFVTKPAESSAVSIAPVAVTEGAQISSHSTAPVATSAYAPVVTSANVPVTASVSLPATETVAAAASTAPSQITSPVTSAVALPVSQPSLTNAKRNDMQSESKVISHSSSTYTPGDPFNTTPQQKPTPPDPNKEEPYKKDEGERKDEDMEKIKDEEDDSSGEESLVEKEGMAENSKEEKNEGGSKAIKEEDKKEEDKEEDKKEDDKKEDMKEENDNAEAKDTEKEFESESDEENTEEEFMNTPVQPFMGMVLVPMVDNQDTDSFRKDNVGAKRGDEKKKEDKKDDDDDEHDHAYLAPLWGYPGWYEAGHGIPYGYGTNMLHGHHCRHGHHYVEFGDHSMGPYGFGRYGCGHHGLGNYGYGHGFGRYGYGLHGFGHHGFGHHGGIRLDNGVIWPYGGQVLAYFNTPCGCNSGSSRSDMGLSLPFSFS